MSPSSLGRRELLLALASLAGCDRRGAGDVPTGAPAASTGNEPALTSAGWTELPFAANGDQGRQHATVFVQPAAPLLIALHGAGEVRKGLVGGSRGWRNDYNLGVAIERLAKPPLTERDFHTFVRKSRLARINAELKRRSYQGLTVACPFTPRLRDRSAAGARLYANFLTARLIAKLRAAKALAATAPVGIDGVSMGGRLALLVGLTHPRVFRSISTLQPAISASEAPMLSALAAKAMAVAPKPRLRLVTSDGDYFRAAVEALSKRLDQDGVAHELLLTPGPHDYSYNRGPGAYEMLLWHDRVLRGEEPV